MTVESREYKLLIDAEPFAAPAKAVAAVWEEIEGEADSLPGVRTKGEFDGKESSRVAFLDTPNRTLRRHGLVLRRRAADGAAAYTLECRSDDRCFAAGTDVGPADGLKAERKLEEDIVPPFLCRYSHSATVGLDAAGRRRSRRSAALQWSFRCRVRSARTGGRALPKRPWKR